MLFSKTYYFKTNLEPSDIVENLEKNSDSKLQFYIYGLPVNMRKPFSGIVTSDSFYLKKNLLYFNSFRPNIEGEFKKVNESTELMVNFKIKWWVLLLTVLILLFFSIIFISFSLMFNRLSDIMGEASDHSNIVLICVFDFLFISAITILFHLETRWGLKELIKILKLEKA